MLFYFIEFELIYVNNYCRLSPIQETSKENRSSCTTGSSSSGNMTSTTRGGTMSGVSMFNSNSRSVSGVQRSASRSSRFTSQNHF